MNDSGMTADPFTNMFEAQAKMMRAALAPFSQGTMIAGNGADLTEWQDAAMKLQSQWLEFQAQQANGPQLVAWGDPARWQELMRGWWAQMPVADPAAQQALWQETVQLWQDVLTQFSAGEDTKPSADDLPRKDKRFADERWRANPAITLLHQTYLMMAERLSEMVDGLTNLPEDKRERLKFFTKAMTDAASPANFPMTNPLVMERTMETKGQNLVTGMEHLIADLKKGQLTHTDGAAFELGKNIATTPGKVVHETPLYQLIQYSPTTEEVLETPLVIFPPWINRFYILDLNEKKSFVRWAVAQGVTVFMVSWKSADASLKDVVWDDYIKAQIEAIDHVRDRLDVDSVHTIGYCVAGTTLAATLALLAERGEADKVKSATFFTAQVDFAEAGDLLHFVDDQQLATIEQLAPDGYLDGRYMAATFNMLRGTDLIWNYVINNYLLGEDYPAFDLLHWNGDVTNLPAKWHQSYLKDLYRDNKLTKGEMEADGVTIDLSKVGTPSYVQAGREDHIAPPESVWKITEHFKGPVRFVLAGSGHIAGVVNPPDARKYQYWTNDEPADTLDAFKDGATEHPGSWWPDWIDWLHTQSDAIVPAKGKRQPGGKKGEMLENAPGRYVMSR